MASCLEGEFFLKVAFMSTSVPAAAGLVQPFQDSISAIYVGGVMLVVVQP